MKTLHFQELESAPGLVVLLHHKKDSPSDADWTQMLDELTRVKKQRGKVAMLSFTDGPSPTSLQRRLASENAHAMGSSPLVAAVSTSPLVRGAVTAASWLGLSARAFTPAELSEALVYVGHAGAEADVVQLCTQMLKTWPNDTATAVTSRGVSRAG